MCATAALSDGAALQTGVASEILDLCARILRETTDARLDAKCGTSDQPGSPGRMLRLAFFAAKQDPVAYHEGLLGHNPRALAVLLLAAEKAGWGSPLPAGHGRGISVQFAYGSYTSQVAEVEVAADGSVKVKRIVCAIDCGMYVNPDTIEAQIKVARCSG
jgi:molybdopterin-binding aldehyde dehydrogenase-like protein